MTDQEIICTFMEPTQSAFHGWWTQRVEDCAGCIYTGPREPRKLDLDALWEVEERLTDEQWSRYMDLFCDITFNPNSGYGVTRRALHATPEQKIRALASVLRPIVEAQ